MFDYKLLVINYGLIKVINPIRGQTEKLSDFDEICMQYNWSMAITMMAIISHNFHATPLIRLVIRIISVIRGQL